MKKILAAILVACGLTTPVQAQDTQQNSYQSRNVEIAGFNRIVVAGAIKVSVRISENESRVQFFGPPHMLADAVAEVEDNTLVIRFADDAQWSWNTGSGMHVFVTVPELVAAALEGPAQLEVSGARGENFAASTSGAGRIELRDMDVGQAEFVTRGSGSIFAEGAAREGAYTTGGSGSIDAKRLRVSNADIVIGGAGSVFADVSQLANVARSSSGSVDIVGGAECVSFGRGSGTVECR